MQHGRPSVGAGARLGGFCQLTDKTGQFTRIECLAGPHRAVACQRLRSLLVALSRVLFIAYLIQQLHYGLCQWRIVEHCRHGAHQAGFTAERFNIESKLAEQARAAHQRLLLSGRKLQRQGLQHALHIRLQGCSLSHYFLE